MRKLLLVSSNTIHTYKYLKLVEDYFDEILLITNEKSTVYEYPTVELSFNLKIKNFFSTVKKIEHHIDTFQPSVIHIHQANSYALFALLANKKRKIPSILTAWGSDILLLPKTNFLFKKMVQFNLRNADFFTSDSTYMAAKMKKLAAPKHEILIANFGIDVTPIACEKENIIYSNRLHKQLYRVDKTILAFKKFIENHKEENWKLVIAATGEETDNLKALVRTLNLTENVEFIGWVNTEINSLWYSKSKFWVSIPESDATAISLLEAMASGCIPIVSDLPANKEWIQNGKNGVVVSDIDSSFIESALSIDQSVAVGMNMERIERDGTKEANKKKFIQLYETILKR